MATISVIAEMVICQSKVFVPDIIIPPKVFIKYTTERSTMNDLQVTEYKNIRVLTTQQIADVYKSDSKTVSYNFNHNKDKYIEGKHYICLTGDELRAFRDFHDLPNNINKIYLWTQKGAFLHAKSLNTDKAWEVYDELVDDYFAKKNHLPTQVPATTSGQIQLLAQGYTEMNERIENVEGKVYSLENDMPLYGCEIEEVSKHVKRRVVNVLGGKDSEAYKDSSVRGQVFSDIYTQIKREYGLVSSYKSIKRKYLADVHDFIDCYELPRYLKSRSMDVMHK